jgi:hypothetical protein
MKTAPALFVSHGSTIWRVGSAALSGRQCTHAGTPGVDAHDLDATAVRLGYALAPLRDEA